MSKCYSRKTDKKGNTKSPEISPPRKDPILNQDSNIITTKKIQKCHHIYKKGHIGQKAFIGNTYYSNLTENEHNNSTDNSRTEN